MLPYINYEQATIQNNPTCLTLYNKIHDQRPYNMYHRYSNNDFRLDLIKDELMFIDFIGLLYRCILGIVPHYLLSKKNRDLKQGFDLEQSSMVSTEYGVDSALVLKDPVDPFIMINSSLIPIDQELFINTYAKPIAVYHHQVDKQCDRVLDIKTKFAYTAPIPQERITRQVDLDVGTFAIFQTISVWH
ncbi:hypothetical protein DFA_10072 [Cavenderia fasciculata]|uniref:Monalysin Pore-forming domain-containing protein n=1 Tax=Cavenderia fasciculata TaxID=261658 RepID=F4Q971_CACFS|nr:uncharacterized protein DFA_10072 [Cavenderia fasciculata]EGG15240.1 hypothetical protein DFA_10072 [Cavenderia fasciculata]|eukprot:XP_004351960.1 hypothetical protein DFA_10072 [Cavenderia fasciculata]